MDLRTVLRPLDVRKTLSAFASLFTQQFDQQDLPTSLRTAVTAIVLGTLPGFGVSIGHGVRSVDDIFVASLVLVLVWMLFTAILFRAEHKSLAIARNVSLVSFWIAATLVLVVLADILFSEPLARGVRFLVVAGLLLVLVPTHLWRIMRSWLAFFGMMFALWLTTGILAWIVIY